MVPFLIENKDGNFGLGVGLTKEEIGSLLLGSPLLIGLNRANRDLPDGVQVQVLALVASEEKDLVETCRKHGFIGENTEVLNAKDLDQWESLDEL